MGWPPKRRHQRSPPPGMSRNSTRQGAATCAGGKANAQPASLERSPAPRRTVARPMSSRHGLSACARRIAQGRERQRLPMERAYMQ
jgi:hypothetical protein